MESLPDDLLLRIFTIGLVELGEPRLPVVVEDEDGLDHGWAGPTGWALGPGRGRGLEAGPGRGRPRGNGSVPGPDNSPEGYVVIWLLTELRQEALQNSLRLYDTLYFVTIVFPTDYLYILLSRHPKIHC